MDVANSPINKISNLLSRRPGSFLICVVLLTLLLTIPVLTMAPNQMASDDPGGRVYDLQSLVDEKLPPRVHGAFFVVEAKDGDILTQKPLWELYQNTQELKSADWRGELSPSELEKQPYLYNGFDTDRQQPISGIYTIADAIQQVLLVDPRLNTNLRQATDEQVKLAVHVVLNEPRTSIFQSTLSNELKVSESRQILGEKITYWSSPAIIFAVIADNEKLGGGGLSIGRPDGKSLNKEEFNRTVQAILRGDQKDYKLWGVAIDSGLELTDEVNTAIPFIVATMIMVLVVIGISLGSLKAVILSALGLGSMLIWLKGLSNLAGLNSSTILDFIVPIAMISLGADFAIHSLSRYREEQRIGLNPRQVLKASMTGVLAALALAMATDAIAFLSNASASIETVIGFGIGAALAIFAAFVILGLALPITLMYWDLRFPSNFDAYTNRKHLRLTSAPISLSAGLVKFVVVTAKLRRGVLPFVALVTIIAGYYSLQLEGSFDVKEFFRSDSDFVIGLDKLDAHVGKSGGEPAIIYIEGELTNPKALKTIKNFLNHAADNHTLAKNDQNEAVIQSRPIFLLIDQAVRSDYARSQIETFTGVPIYLDESALEFTYAGNTFLVPNSKVQLQAIYDYIVVHGVPINANQLIYDSLEVKETLFHEPKEEGKDATTILLGVPGTREQINVINSRNEILNDLKILRDEPAISDAGLTGSPYTRQAALDASTRALQRALPIAIIGCLLITIFAMRSVRFGVVTIIPIILVVAWLYALMYAFGFGLNFVTATIAAVSIGVGIDYAVHMTQRFRQELRKSPDKFQALSQATSGTGMALIASATTSILGFAIMGFAPMPLFSSYGILTALMILLAAIASIVVLPCLLILVTPSSVEPSPETILDRPHESNSPPI